jgi:hypothetical protein
MRQCLKRIRSTRHSVHGTERASYSLEGVAMSMNRSRYVVLVISIFEGYLVSDQEFLGRPANSEAFMKEIFGSDAKL